MTTRIVEVDGRRTLLLEEGQGEPLLYLHGFADVHGAVPDWLDVHRQLQEQFRIIAPAHPGCAGSDGATDMDTIEDVVLHYVELADSLALERFSLVGTCLGGWIAAELAVRYPQRVRRLVLVGASGLEVPGELIGDLFMLSQPRDGGDHSDLRSLLFGSADAPLAMDMFPDGRASIEHELLRFQTLTFAGRIGWSPPYLYDPKLRRRLRRLTSPTLAVWGETDRLVPLAHGRAYVEGVSDGRLEVLPAGHSVHLEQPAETARLIAQFLVGPGPG
ncbi:MAG: alpha/beta fold hydrolase [Chloroflexi bacterium]|nr:alpha/beta fold hydrolase [Chloroflexota bacterium]